MQARAQLTPVLGDQAAQARRDEHARALFAALLFPVGAVAWDLVRVIGVAPRLTDASSIASFTISAWALGAVLASVVLLARSQLAERLASSGPGGHALLGALEAFVLFLLAVVVQDPRTLDMDLRVWLLAGVVGSWALLRWLLARLGLQKKERVLRALALAFLVGVVIALAGLRWNGQRFTRLALQLAGAVALSGALPTQTSARARRALRPALAAALVIALGSGALLDLSPGARLALHHKSSHARAWALLYDRTRGVFGEPLESVAAQVPGSTAAGSSERAARAVGAGETPSADVLLLSIDSLRADAVDALPALRSALGPHALFEQAYSPAPGTKESLSATLRGRAVRTLRFEEAPLARGRILWRDPSQTLAHALVRAGYRAITVPTSNIAEPRLGVQSGFESIWVANFDARKRLPDRSPFTQVVVPADEVTALALQAARDTRTPLFMWLHFMDTHAPYHVSTAASGAESSHQRFERSVRELDARLARFLNELRSIRGRQPIVVVFGDHGEEFDEHGGSYHASSVFAEQVHVAFLLAAPGVPSGVVAAPVTTAQLPATVLQLLGAPVPESMTEPSLLPPTASTRTPLAVSEVRADGMTMTAYTAPRYRYLNDPAHDVELLFDLHADPFDQRDLSAQQPQALHAMRVLARAWDAVH